MHREIAGKLTGRRTKWISLAFWIVVLGVAMVPASKLTDVQENDTVNWLPGSAESTQAFQKLDLFQNPDAADTVVVYDNPSGITDADKAKIDADKAKIIQLKRISDEVQGPVTSQDGEAVVMTYSMDLGSNGWTEAVDIVKDMRAIANTDASGMRAYVTGPGGMAADSGEAFEGIDGKLLGTAALVVIVILLLTYRSPFLWLLPLLSAGIALTSAEAVIYVLAKYAGLTVNAQSQGILTVLVFGAGTDYALLLVARYREELRSHENRHEAMALALHRAGPAIFASAATVVAGMLCLLIAETNSTASLGPVAAIGIVVGLGAMLTLLPAMLVILGRWIFWPRVPHYASDSHITAGSWARVGQRIAVRPRTVWVVTTVVLGVACIGLVKLNATGLATEDQYTKTVGSVTGQQVLEEHFPAGSAEPVQIMSTADQADAVAAAASKVEGIAAVSDPIVASLNGPNVNEAMTLATLSDPPDSDAANDTIDRLRDAVHAVPGADALVGGQTAINLDAQRASQHDRDVVIPLVLLVVFIILALLLRAIVAPLILIATVVLSFGAALGLSALIFHYVFDFAGADSSLPLFVFVFLVALGIDYNIFLMTRVREEAMKYGTRRGALIGLAATGGVITSAGLVLAGTFAALATLPLVAFAEIGFAVALGVLLDTLVVRSVLVTALNLDVGPTMWWPGSLQHKRDVDLDELREEDRALVG
jgi:putative drug exporter of the RND superfamily